MSHPSSETRRRTIMRAILTFGLAPLAFTLLALLPAVGRAAEVILDPDPDVIGRWPQWEQDLYRKLEQPLAVDLNNASLEDVARFLSDRLGVNVVVSLREAEAEAPPA